MLNTTSFTSERILNRSTIAIIVGMRSEAALLPTSLPVVCSGGRPAKARRLADELLAAGATGLISFELPAD